MLELEFVSCAFCEIVEGENSLGNAGGRDEDVNVAVMVDRILDGLVDSVSVTDVNLVETDVDTGLLGQLLGGLFSELLLHIHNGNALDSDLRESLGHVVSKTTSTTSEGQLFGDACDIRDSLPSHNGDLAVESELAHSGGELRSDLRVQGFGDNFLVLLSGVHRLVLIRDV